LSAREGRGKVWKGFPRRRKKTTTGLAGITEDQENGLSISRVRERKIFLQKTVEGVRGEYAREVAKGNRGTRQTEGKRG